jgi:hypothetical protein
MMDSISRLESGDLVAVLVVAAVMATVLISAATSVWGNVRRAQILANLKQDMLDRGMSAEEIKTVLEAGSGSENR